jgi:hypothetical protein
MRKTLCGLGIMLFVLLGPTATVAFTNDLEGNEESGVEEIQAGSGSLADAGMREDLLTAFIRFFVAFVTLDGPLAELLDFTTAIAVGVERSAIGSDDNPLTDFLDALREGSAPGAAAFVEQFFDTLIEELGPKLLADVDPILLPPAFDVDNGRADDATVWLPTGSFVLDIGNSHNVGDGEFSRVTLGLVDSDGDDNDAEQLLSEIVTGISGANLDFEWKPGIVGVHLVDISLEEYTLELEDGDTTDLLTFCGPGAEAVFAKLDAPANLVDFRNDLSFVEIGVEEVNVGLWWNPISDLVGWCLCTAEDVEALMDAALSGDERIELIGFDDSRISLIVRNGLTGSADMLILFGDIVEGVLSAP